MTIIDCKNVTKRFKTSWTTSITALDNVDLEVNQGEIFGILGPNGAGKTTLVKILLNLVFPDEGTVKMFDQDVKDYRVRKRVGYLPENPNLPPYLTGAQLMELFGRMSGLDKETVAKRTEDLLKEVKMDQWASKKNSTYSKGMKQRLGLAQAMISDPDIIFLDEPTDGVDPIGRQEIRGVLHGLKEKGKTIFLNSHLLSETEMLCDHVAVMDKGKIVASGSIDELTTVSNNYKIKCESLNESLIGKLNEVIPVASNNGTLDANVDTMENLNKVIDMIRQSGKNIESIVPVKQSLESYFIDLIKDVREERDEL